MNQYKTTILLLFVVQIFLMLHGTYSIPMEVNPFVILVVSGLFTYVSFQVLARSEWATGAANSQPFYFPWIHAAVGMFGLYTTFEGLRKIWVKFPDPRNISDVLPQLEAQCAWFFSGEYPYRPVTELEHAPFPIYMPLHWGPVQIANLMHLDTRWSAMIMLFFAIGLAGYWLSQTQPNLLLNRSLISMILFALPVWGFIVWGGVDIAVSLEGTVAAWYLVLATGLVARVFPLIILGLIGCLLSRYTLLFWLFPFAALLWFNEPKKYSYLTWSVVGAVVAALFIVPFLLKDPSIIEQIQHQYYICSERSWIKPDEYTFREGLSLNIHLRHWLPGAPEDSLGYMHLPQILVQLLVGGVGVYFYQQRWKTRMPWHIFALLLLSLLIVLFYAFSPMLFRYYMLMPLTVMGLVCWKVYNASQTHLNLGASTD